jgi:hypothetical protein
VTDINLENAADGTHTLNIAISKTSNPSGAWWVYHVVVATGGDFWDFPHSGQTQDAILITGNLFFAAGGAEGRAFAVAKARLYNGLGFFVPIFTGLPFNFIPPNVMDQSNVAWCAHPELNNGTNNIDLFDFGDAANAFEAFISGPFVVSTGIAQNSPPPASQPGTASTIDTLDGRFQYRGQQNGNRLLLTNCVNLAGFPTTALYDINTASMTASSSNYYFASGTSDDWNPHVALLQSGNVGVEWTSDDPSAGINAGIRIAGGASSSISGSGTGTTIFTSSTNYFDVRWGDYSSLQVDPSAATTLWGANEYIIGNFAWGTKFFSFTVP